MFLSLGGEGAINTFVVCFSIVDYFNCVGCEGDGENLAARSVLAR